MLLSTPALLLSDGLLMLMISGIIAIDVGLRTQGQGTFGGHILYQLYLSVGERNTLAWLPAQRNVAIAYRTERTGRRPTEVNVNNEFPTAAANAATEAETQPSKALVSVCIPSGFMNKLYIHEFETLCTRLTAMRRRRWWWRCITCWGTRSAETSSHLRIITAGTGPSSTGKVVQCTQQRLLLRSLRM